MLDAYADRWALITGASSGLGAVFAERLAARGMHVVLVARREDPMRELAGELHVRHGTESLIVPGDLSQPGAVSHVMQQVRERDVPVELLVNNAAFAVVEAVEKTDAGRLAEMLRLNVIATTELVYAVLPAMLQRGHGAILNLSSLAAFQPVAYMGPYAATKTYMLHFSEALWAEVRERGVTVTAVCPGVTRTNLFEAAGVGAWLKKQRSQSPEQVVKAALKALERRKPYVVSGWRNYFVSLASRFAPRKTVVLESMKYFRPTAEPAERKPVDSAREEPPPEGSQPEDGSSSADEDAPVEESRS